ncbi:NAD(P)/FAD-dependent oxidoreductase [Trichloromonas sp.]|uniref:NAD(P)/FAD-dependent oxidoreductase n=1 Tax=Trichloromonas sp. TaxID=3069249 RepID=UPI002A4D7CE8|nr:FAD-dependent oxidoreductase [Trichloromonas sp.]
MGKHLVLVGGGHAHLPVLQQLGRLADSGHRVTLVTPDDNHYYSGMGPGMLAGIYTLEQGCFAVAHMAEKAGATVVRAAATGLDAEGRILKLSDGSTLPYDLISFNLGSRVAVELPDDGSCPVLPVKPIQKLLEARKLLLAMLSEGRKNLVVIGGGASGVELCGALWRLLRDVRGHGEITLVGGKRLLADFPERARELALASLAARGIRILEGVRAQRVADQHVLLDDGDEIPADLVLLAGGIAPPSLFVEAGLAVGDDGGMLVDDTLRSLSYPEILGGGDCISLGQNPLPKVGVYAVRQGPVLAANLLAALEDEPLEQFVPQRLFLRILNLGDGRGLLQRGELVLVGRWAFLLKDWIDRRFMARYSK